MRLDYALLEDLGRLLAVLDLDLREIILVNRVAVGQQENGLGDGFFVPVLADADHLAVIPVAIVVKFGISLEFTHFSLGPAALVGFLRHLVGYDPVVSVTLDRVRSSRIGVQAEGILERLDDNILLEGSVRAVLGVHPPSTHSAGHLILTGVVHNRVCV